MTTTKSGIAVIALFALFGSSGCYTTTISSGKPVGSAPFDYDGKWHSGFIEGIAEVSGPYNLQQICPQGWAEIETKTTFLNGFVQWFTGVVYNPQTVTVRCAKAGSPVNSPVSPVAPAAAVPPAAPAQ